MNWQKTGTRATAADPSAMLLVFSGFGRLHFTMKFESDLFPDSSKLDSDSLPTSMQFGVHWQKIRATLIRLKVLHSLLLLFWVLLLSSWLLLLLSVVLLLLLLLIFWTQLPNLEMHPIFGSVVVGLEGWKRKRGKFSFQS